MISRDRPKSAASTGSSRGGRVAVTWALLVGTTGHQGHCKCTTPGAYLKVPQCSTEVVQCSAVWPPHPWRCWSHLTVRRTRAAQSLVQASASVLSVLPCRGPTAAAAAANCVSPDTEVAATSIALQRPCHHPSPSSPYCTTQNEGYPKISQSQRRPLLVEQLVSEVFHYSGLGRDQPRTGAVCGTPLLSSCHESLLPLLPRTPVAVSAAAKLLSSITSTECKLLRIGRDETFIQCHSVRLSSVRGL